MEVNRSPEMVPFKEGQKEPKKEFYGSQHFKGELRKLTHAKGLTEWPEQFLKVRSMISQKLG